MSSKYNCSNSVLDSDPKVIKIKRSLFSNQPCVHEGSTCVISIHLEEHKTNSSESNLLVINSDDWNNWAIVEIGKIDLSREKVFDGKGIIIPGQKTIFSPDAGGYIVRYNFVEENIFRN